MRCPECGSPELKTHDTRQRFDEEGSFAYTVRIRRCKDCNHRFRTIEVEINLFNQQFEEDEECEDQQSLEP